VPECVCGQGLHTRPRWGSLHLPDSLAGLRGRAKNRVGEKKDRGTREDGRERGEKEFCSFEKLS